MIKNNYLKGFLALSTLGVSIGTIADENQSDLGPLSPLEVAREQSVYNLDPTSPEYQEMLARRQLMLELNQMYQELENHYSLEREMMNEIPLPPERVIEHRRQRQELERASNIRVTGPVEEKFETMDLPIEQTKVIEVNVVPGYLSTLTFFDSTGAPWPIEYAQPGNQTFQMNVAGASGNIINLDTSSMFADANASIGLVGQNHNYIIRLIANDKKNTSRLSFRVPDRGPEARQQTSRTRSVVENAPPEMYDIINGRIHNLDGVKHLNVSGVQADAYEYNGFIYIVSRHNLLSPARENSVSLPSGTTAYKIYPTSSLQFSVDGERVFATIENQIGRR